MFKVEWASLSLNDETCPSPHLVFIYSQKIKVRFIFTIEIFSDYAEKSWMRTVYDFTSSDDLQTAFSA